MGRFGGRGGVRKMLVKNKCVSFVWYWLISLMDMWYFNYYDSVMMMMIIVMMTNNDDDLPPPPRWKCDGFYFYKLYNLRIACWGGPPNLNQKYGPPINVNKCQVSMDLESDKQSQYIQLMMIVSIYKHIYIHHIYQLNIIERNRWYVATTSTLGR